MKKNIRASFNSTSSVANLNLTAAVEPKHTYHVLLLAGYRPDKDTNPTLLASSYTKFTANGPSNSLKLWLIPVVVEMKFSGGSDGDRQLGRLAKTVGLDAAQTYTLEYFIGSNNRGVMATGDALKDAINDGLWPLKLASADVRQDDTWFYKYSKEDPVTKVHETLGSYVPGVLDAVEVPLNNAYGTNLASVEWSDDRIDAMNDLSVDKVSKKTTGRGKYEFKTRRETLMSDAVTPMTGRVWFHLEYVPFAVFDDEAWRTAQRPASATALKARPVWVIRNGLTDAKQDASTWTDGTTYNSADGKGGISLGVAPSGGVAAQGRMGIYEDNNPWPIDGISISGDPTDLTPALAFLDSKGAKGAYGDYTIKLGVPPYVSDFDYPAILNTGLIIDGTVPITMGIIEGPLSNTLSNRLSYGPNVTLVPAARKTMGAISSSNVSQFNAIARDDRDGSIYVVGSQYGTTSVTYGNNIGNNVGTYTVAGFVPSQANAVIVKYNSDGEAQWAKISTSSSTTNLAYAQFSSVAVSPDGQYVYAAGMQQGQNTITHTYGGVPLKGSGKDSNSVIVKYDSTGSVGWANSVVTDTPQQGFSAFNSVAVDLSGNVYAAGYQADSAGVDYGDNITASGAATSANSVIVKYDSSFTTKWAKPVTAGSDTSGFRGIALDGLGGIYAVGYQRGTGEFKYSGAISATATVGSVDYNAVIVKYDSGSGAALWAQAVTGGNERSLFQGLIPDGLGGVYVVGYQSGSGEFNYGNNIKRPGTGLYGGGNNALVVRYR
jgi:hypothetical protein